MNSDYHTHVAPLPCPKADLKDGGRQHKILSINFNNILDCNYVSGVKLDTYNEYIQFLESKQVQQDNGHFHVSPPIHLMPPPPQNISNVNNNNISSVNLNKKTNWKNRLDSVVQSPHESENEETCQSYIYKKPDNRKFFFIFHVN